MSEPVLTVDTVIQQLAARRADALVTLSMLREQRMKVEGDAARLENPAVVLEYLDFFITAVDEVVVAIDRMSEELRERVQRAHIELLRQIAANCRVEQRRCLVFRDRCINRPLPHEQMRPLLNDISVTTRDQLTAFYDFNSAAARLEQIITTSQSEPEPDPKRTLGRRALFTRLFKLPKDE